MLSKCRTFALEKEQIATFESLCVAFVSMKK